ncbi:phosphomannomutase/phosphoglucomutase [Cyanobacterium aponinum UTEX 3221]|uniref:phosphomannomutase/phosphoglucomutase n=1 Tax=Cyanobacterium aponinum TaxID=379064 RepID=UPI000C12C385|nr:phosphomannomutase/phosphoglucomutase [Cyanobacterium aponinum]PHV62951.1 phosphomannomutase/phosphoglucomutase [Cyanobacterium aponinum IPPAS B-1201]WRL37761.1 phosphomannomutase/phosphoglucomutase [Cyanobacterium aponinum UTEX 3221]
MVNWQKLQNGSDIRGVALEGIEGEEVNLTPEVVKTLGKAFTQWLQQKTEKKLNQLVISIGRDSRLSGEVLAQAVTLGITSLGAKVLNFDLCSTPAMFMSCITEGFNCDGAIMLTASHLPFNRNGLKFFTPDGGLEKQNIADILAIAEKNVFSETNEEGKVENHDFISVYSNLFVEKIRSHVNHPQHFEQPLKGLKIIVDAGNGAGGFYAEKVLKPLGADITGSQFLEPDGNFPNHIPNPENKEAMASIAQAVIDNQADFGIIFDTDVDRSAAVDSQGKELNRNRLIALISSIILKEHPRSTIVTDSITSDGLTKFIEDLGGKHHRFKRGYKNVINESLRLNKVGEESWVAIETSGHAALKENYFLDDGAYLVTKLLIELAKLRLKGQNLTDLISNLIEPIESEEFRLKINVEDFQNYGNNVIDKLGFYVENQADWEIVTPNYEGIRVSCSSPEEQGWFLLRLSLHDPVIPLNIETNVQGGVNKIASRLTVFFQEFSHLDLSVFDNSGFKGSEC